MGGAVERITLPCQDLAPLLVRRRVAELPGLGWQLGDAMLVATELVTNAVRHSGCRADDSLEVSLERMVANVRVAVRDPGRSGTTARISEESDWFGGLGLKIVAQLASRWGSERRRDGYEVWADLPVTAAEHAEPDRRQAGTGVGSKELIDPAVRAGG